MGDSQAFGLSAHCATGNTGTSPSGNRLGCPVNCAKSMQHASGACHLKWSFSIAIRHNRCVLRRRQVRELAMSENLQRVVKEYHAFYEVSPYYVMVEEKHGGHVANARRVQAGFDVDVYGVSNKSELELPPPPNTRSVTPS